MPAPKETPPIIATFPAPMIFEQTMTTQVAAIRKS